MTNKCTCGCNPQPGKLNINSKLNKDFNKPIKSPNQSELNKQMLIQQINDKPGSSYSSDHKECVPNNLVLEQLKNIEEDIEELNSELEETNEKIGDMVEPILIEEIEDIFEEE